jgi:cell division transport system permease protein
VNQSARKTAVKDKGASHSRATLKDRFSGYLSNHRLVAKDSLQRLLRAPIPSLMTWLVIGIALALPTGLYVTLSNIEAVSRGWDGAAQISLYLHKAVAEPDGRALAQKLEQRADIDSVRFISPAEALAEFQQLSGYGEVIDHLDSNPLPAVIVVWPEETNSSAEQVHTLYGYLSELPGVDQAVIDLEWVQRLYSMMAVGKRMTLTLAALLSLGVLLVIGNTIRLAIENRRDEIVIVKLVGGTDAFVRRPFLYTGLWYGVGGGLVAWLVISVALLWLGGPVSELSGLYQSQYQLQGLGFGDVLLLWMAAGALGLAGAWLAVGRHLGAIEPR